ncbi:probable malonyl-CoA-acyl carrier protein transacylase, mitochondrial isoform X1 [Hydra vulgaris]|uniref:Probable malonyl-CoA-acyl carrier protein transacylase, mitochondrial isoform X1 n=1 Tax=Hydra vulgaris TaxID=6087 RepID=A0ABM4DJU1_HYDVU
MYTVFNFKNFYSDLNKKLILRKAFILFFSTQKNNALIMCPSQGTQFVGMLAKVDVTNYVYKQLIDLAKNTLGYNLLDKCKHGPQELLTRTLYSQPAILLSTLLIAENLKMDKSLKWKSIVGYSLGELSALAAAGCISYEDIFKIIKVRASAMEKAVSSTPSGMIFLEGLTVSEVNELCDDLSKTSSKRLYLATHLFECGVTVGGSLDLLNKILNQEHSLVNSLLKEDKVKISKVHVSGAFHTPYMQPAQELLNDVLQNIAIQPTDIKLYSNVTGKPYENINCIKNLLVRQVCEPLLWYSVLQSINEDYLNEFYDVVFELSRIKQIKTMIGKVNQNMMTKVVNLWI